MKKLKNIRKKRLSLTFLVLFLLILLVLSLSIIIFNSLTVNLKNIEKYEGKRVTIEGKVLNHLKIGSLNAYELEVDEQKLMVTVKNNNLPAINSTIKLTGTIYKDPLIGYELLLG